MKRFLVITCVVMVVFTFLSMCAVGTWATWYPWPPTKKGYFDDIQWDIWYTWFWMVFLPTIVTVFTTAIYGEHKKWWK